MVMLSLDEVVELVRKGFDVERIEYHSPDGEHETKFSLKFILKEGAFEIATDSFEVPMWVVEEAIREGLGTYRLREPEPVPDLEKDEVLYPVMRAVVLADKFVKERGQVLKSLLDKCTVRVHIGEYAQKVIVEGEYKGVKISVLRDFVSREKIIGDVALARSIVEEWGFRGESSKLGGVSFFGDEVDAYFYGSDYHVNISLVPKSMFWERVRLAFEVLEKYKLRPVFVEVYDTGVEVEFPKTSNIDYYPGDSSLILYLDDDLGLTDVGVHVDDIDRDAEWLFTVAEKAGVASREGVRALRKIVGG
ncbi:hypothetical protein [Pyrococcus kukulkanii]|uniref:hypothetical protein n=1 Tax=Pyrococcus kukulkanii TaxID=1609559 RepID=UPI003566C865